MEITIRQRIYYSNKDPVPIKQVAETLVALEGVISQSPDVLEAMLRPGIVIDKVDVFIDELKSDSLLEDVVIKFVFKDQQGLDNFIATTRDRFSMDEIMNNPDFLSAILLAMILTGGAYYLGKHRSSGHKQKAVIEANNNVIINIGADISGLEADDLKDIIESAIKDKDRLAKDAIKLIKPAKRDSDAAITFNDNDDLKINNDSVKAMPDHIEEPEEEQDIQDFNDVELVIRATDLDSSKKGWGVVIPELSAKRARMKLDMSVHPEDLGNRNSIRGSVTVVFGYDKNNIKIPKIVLLREIKN